ncbi:hypothetical protein [Paracidovorax valerianellae]|uniref:hypothetical protein n=1 Tax=Paracidovorax valerianellae TaxID=187868 RepID=UPI002304077E|nr:hypothetical protein [Paracidovorax valerianellae]MDA8445297.1 hypothetical protein [Paracidovorax valerianellae]
MTIAELEALAHAVAKLAFVAGLAGAIAAHLLMLIAARMVSILGQCIDRMHRVSQARKRAHG